MSKVVVVFPMGYMSSLGGAIDKIIFENAMANNNERGELIIYQKGEGILEPATEQHWTFNTIAVFKEWIYWKIE